MKLQLQGILETALYVEDLERSRDFFVGLFGLKVLFEDDRMSALRISAEHVLLLFVRGASLDGSELPGGFIPAHDGSGPVHMAFHVHLEDLPAWKEHLASHGVPVISELTLNQGKSIYFNDPDGHVLELGSPGLWQVSTAPSTNP